MSSPFSTVLLLRAALPLLAALLLGACVAASNKPEAPVSAPSAPLLSSFVGTWQEGEPCERDFARMVLREGEGVIEGQWAFFSKGWGLSTGSLRASPDGAYLRLETCQDAATWGTHPPRYAYGECPELDFWDGARGVRVDESTGELLWVSPSLRETARMKRVDPSNVVSLDCPQADSAE